MDYKLKDYDKVLSELIEALSEQKINLSSSNADGRVNSIDNEKELTNLILNVYKKLPTFKKLNLVVEEQDKPRCWYDILIKDQNLSFFCPINIKISNFKNSSADNISSKEGLFFSLTGEIQEKCPNTWGKYFNLLSKKIKDNSTDYFFIILNKDNNSIYFNSLKRLKTLTPNGNNLPFQCKWSENTEIVNREFNESKKFLLDVLFKSVKNRAKILDEFFESFKEYLPPKK